MKEFLKVLFHCVCGTIRLEKHSLCYEMLWWGRRYFCSCGYNNDGITWDEYLEGQ
jgi:hypothetical protein